MACVNSADGEEYLILCESPRAQNGDAYCQTHQKWHRPRTTRPDEPRPGFLTIRFCDERGQKLAEIVILPGNGSKIAIPLDAEHMHADTGTPLDREVTQ